MPVVLLLWTLLATAQTNAPEAASNHSDATNSSLSMGKLLDPLLHKAPVSFGLDNLPYLETEFLGNPLWKYASFGIYILMAMVMTKLIDLVFLAWLKRLASKTATQFDDLFLGLIGGPIKIIVFVILLHIGLDIFSWPVWMQKYLSIALKMMVAGSLTYLSIRLVDLLLTFWKTKAAAVDGDKLFAEQLYPVARISARTFVIVMAILFTSQNLGLNITSVLASLSVGGLALGLAAQDTLANLFGAIVIFLDKPFKIGDRIQLEGGVDGIVEKIGLRSTRVRSLDGYLITVPNTTMGKATITNINARPTIKTVMDFGLTYETTPEQMTRAVAVLTEIFKSHPMTHDLLVGFNEFANSSMNIRVIHWWKNTDYKTHMAGMQELNLAVLKRFNDEKLEMAFPSQTLYLKQTAASQTDP
jgi:MscS family membrane protein